MKQYRMSALFNQTNINETDTFSGTTGAFPNGISIGTSPTTQLDNFNVSTGIVSLAAIDPTTNDLAPFQAAVFYSGTGQQGSGYYSIDSATINWTGNTINQEIPIVSASDSTGVNQVALTNISTINGAPVGASIPYISSIDLPFAPTLNSGQKAGISTLLMGLPTGSTIHAQAQITIVPPTGCNVEGTLLFGMGMTSSDLTFNNYYPYYFNTANAQQNMTVQMNGLINIPNATDTFAITCSNASGGGVITDFTCSKITFVSP